MAAPIEPTETELKLAVAERDLPRLLRRLGRLGPAVRREIDSVYLDTADARLAEAGFALRLRRAGRRWVQTLKSSGGNAPLAVRSEWEVPAPRGRLRVAAFGATPLEGLLAGNHAELVPQFRTRFVRTARNVQAGGARIEVALDVGVIEAGTARADLCELELELKAGAPSALFDLALVLCEGRGRSGALALLAAGESKAARGRRLARALSQVPCKADAARLFGAAAPGSTPTAALRGVVERGVGALVENVHGALAHDDAEFVHQARVATRRLRTAVRALGAAAAFPEELASELRWAGRRLGSARDWDVLVEETLPAAVEALPEQRAAIAQIGAAAGAARRRAVRRVRAALRSPRFALLVLRLLRWAALPGQADRDERELGRLAEDELAEARRIVLKGGARFGRANAEARHRTRVRVKRLRYLLELFAPLLPAATRRELAHCAALQSSLGAMNDARVARALLRDAVPPSKTRAALLGWLREREREFASQAQRLFA